jgi:hypothetical protein
MARRDAIGNVITKANTDSTMPTGEVGGSSR